jgi:hypothetical protein
MYLKIPGYRLSMDSLKMTMDIHGYPWKEHGNTWIFQVNGQCPY